MCYVRDIVAMQNSLDKVLNCLLFGVFLTDMEVISIFLLKEKREIG